MFESCRDRHPQKVENPNVIGLSGAFSFRSGARFLASSPNYQRKGSRGNARRRSPRQQHGDSNADANADLGGALEGFFQVKCDVSAKQHMLLRDRPELGHQIGARCRSSCTSLSLT
jgi:hypothetical protein